MKFNPLLHKSKTKSFISVLVLHFSVAFFIAEMTVIVTGLK